ncbi:MAG: hypothetical protein R2687_00145 [Candidatus Nanopelagicales bacterium]
MDGQLTPPALRVVPRGSGPLCNAACDGFVFGLRPTLEDAPRGQAACEATMLLYSSQCRDISRIGVTKVVEAVADWAT